MPSLEVQDFPQGGFVDMKMAQSSSTINANTKEHDILQEILSVAQVSQDLINQDSWSRSYAPSNNFSFLPHSEQVPHGMSMSTSNSSGFVGNTSSLGVGGSDEGLKSERVVENLRWVGNVKQRSTEGTNFVTLYFTEESSPQDMPNS